MPIERQSEQWPHRREAMLRAARDDEDYSKYEKSFYAPAAPKTPQNYSPTQYNSPLHPARPGVSWQATEPEQSVLPMDFPAQNDAYGPDHALPVDRQPNTLYRGIKLYLDHPNAAHIRRMVYGDALENQHDGNEWNEYRTDWGSTHRYEPGRSPTLPGMPSSQEMAAPGNPLHPALGQAILDYMSQYKDSTGLGRHWSITQGNGAWSKDHGSFDPRPHLPVEITGEWLGHGEDPERTETGWDKETEADFPSEKEITLLPGAPINVTDLRVQHPHTQQWHSILPEPQQRFAADRSDRINMPTEYSSPGKPYSTARPKTYWEGMDPEQDVLPLRYPNRVLPVDGQPGMPRTIPGDKDVRPEVLYRGLSIPLLHPDLGAVRAAFMPNLGPSMDWGETAPLPGMGKELEWRDGWPRSRDLPEGFDPTNLGHHILNWAQDNRKETGLGRHWTTQQHIADTFAHRSVYNSGHGVHYVPVRLTAEWTGLGEDTKRSYTGGEFHSESEITMLPGTNLRVTGVHVWHPRAEKWYSVLDQPQHRTAAGPFNLHDTDYYKGRSMVDVPAQDFKTNPLGPVAGGRAYNFPATGFNPPSNSKGRPRLTWESDEPEQDVLPMDFPTETTIDSGISPDHPNYKEPQSLPFDRKPQTLYRGLTVDLAMPDAAHIRRTLYGPEWEGTFGHYGHPPLPGMPDTKELADHWNAYDYENPGLGPMLLDHLSDHYDHHNLGQHWTIYPNVGMEFGEDGNSRMGLPLNVVLSAEWRGAGEDPYRRATMGNWPHEGEITLLPEAPLHVTKVHVQHPHTKQWHNVLDTPQHRQAALKTAWPGPKGYPWEPGGDYDHDYLERLPIHENEYGERRRFSPTTINPPSDSEARPSINWSPADPPQPTLDLDLPDAVHYRDPDDPYDIYSVPVDREPQRMYRGIMVDLAHPDLGPVRRRLYDDRREYEYGDGTAAHRYLPGMPHDHEIARGPWALRSDPDLANLLLDHINKGHNSAFTRNTTLGRHWSTDYDTAVQFAGPEMSNEDYELPLPVVLGADWYGHGEDPYRRQTGGDFPEEHEVTMLPGAPLHLQEMHLEHPDTGEMVPLTLTPHHREAALFYDRGDYDPADFFTSRGGTCTMCRRPRRLPPGPFCSHGEGEEEFRRRLELDPNTPFRTAGYYDEDWDEDDDYHEGTPQVVHPIDTFTPMFPGSGRRPVFHDRELGRDVYHFSPHERNPQSDGYTRPELNWRAQTEDLDQPGLPGIPADRQPVRLYRGVSVDLDRPEAHRLRRLVHPQRFDNREDATGFQRRPIGWGQFQEEPYLGVDMSNKELRSKVPAGGEYDPDEVRQLVLDHLLQYGDGGLGTHWSTDKGQAQMFARHNSNAMGTNILPVVLHHDWYGYGEDPYRRGTEGEWTEEKEITKLPHAAVNLVGMDIWHDGANGLSRWHNIYNGEPLRYEAGVR